MRLDNRTNRLLGYPPDARLLIINADDFGMCHAVNEAVVRALPAGVLRSTSLLVPCPWAWNAMRFLAAHPEIPFGIELAVIAEWPEYPWGPLLPASRVPTLVNEHGHFYNFDQMGGFLDSVDLGELEMEFRAQIETVLAFGLQPTHLDWHCLRLEGRDAVSELMLRLAREYGLALRSVVRSQIEMAKKLGLPTNDGGFLDSYQVDPATKASHYTNLLRNLPAGLSDWAIHPGLDTPELLTIEPEGNHIRQTDFDFLISPLAKEVIAAEGIILMDYRALQAIWRDG